MIQIKGKDSINLNISPDFVAVLNYCLKSWEQAQKSLRLNPSQQDPSREMKDIFSEEVKTADKRSSFTKESNPLINLFDEDVVDVATPYRIRNLTGKIIFVETLFGMNKEKYMLHDNQTTKVAISYEKQTSTNYDGINSKINDNVKILFEGLYLPIESKFCRFYGIEISLNKLTQSIHKLTDNDVSNLRFIFYRRSMTFFSTKPV